MAAPQRSAHVPADALRLRLLSGVVLGAAAIAATVVGGYSFALFWAIAAIAVAAEWVGLFAAARKPAAILSAAVALLAAAGLLQWMSLGSSLLAVAAGILVTAILAGPVAGLGLVYAAPIVLGCMLLRADPQFGLAAIVWLFAVVWGTDVAAYFIGRAARGPKLWPAVSPGKTWSGAAGGALVATVTSVLVAGLFGARDFLALSALGLFVSIVAQAGDLFESGLKRKAGVKDSGHIIPGHGGAMDRLDGFTTAACVAAAIGVAHAGAGAAGQGLLLW